MAYIFLLTLFALIGESLSELCIASSYYSSYVYYTYCSSGCCGGSFYSQYCCSSLEVGAIAGIVIGCIFALAIIIVIVICVCAQFNKKKTGVIISNNTQQQRNVAVVATYNQQGVYHQPPPSYPTPNQLYMTPAAYPPGGVNQPGPSDPAYPPPNTAPPP
ncbi:cysteine and tyrosine-rich protein 1-like [Pecten maximus]|uniref:cysteine and tyrosine-rich protein 1-like n=1 Tax=Pecten maximus TaxID=6579 RepID=UPI0014580A84|nr:cysteine and tyrosine-rich protein 1-like [Pecten maximus]